ncbi:hypothetical protein PFISCL1PPCAC_16134, partial [Pristionchus fissidentatus]
PLPPPEVPRLVYDVGSRIVVCGDHRNTKIAVPIEAISLLQESSADRRKMIFTFPEGLIVCEVFSHIRNVKHNIDRLSGVLPLLSIDTVTTRLG